MSLPFLQVRAASTANVALPGAITSIDGISLNYSDLILLKDQSNPAQNGIYTAGPAAARAIGYNSNLTQFAGLSVVAIQGQINASSQWTFISNPAGTLGTDPIQFAQITGSQMQVIPQGLDPTGQNDARDIIQKCIDSLVQFNYQKDYSAVIQQPPGGFTLKFNATVNFDDTITHVYPTSPTTVAVVTLPNVAPTPNASPRAIIVLMGDGMVRFQTAPGALMINNLYLTTSPPVINSRFRAVRVTIITNAGPPPTYTYVLDDVGPTGGGTIRFPAGQFLISGNGLKLHPAVNMIGDEFSSTIFIADQSMTGQQDASGTTSAALLTICARAPSTSAKSINMFQTLVQNLQFNGSNASTANISGVVLEAGAIDPYYTSSGQYSGSSASFFNVGIFNFSGYGILSQADRQRFYCEALRSLFNQIGGLKIAGNDAVIGPRTGIGANGSTLATVDSQIYVSDCSGLVMNGVNVFSGNQFRSAACLALHIQNVNGATITGCVFNDTVNIDGGQNKTNIDTAITITGCIFNPNSGVFTLNQGIPVPVGTTPNDSYDSYIRVSDVVNLNVSGNSFCASGTFTTPPPPPGRFAYLVAAVANARIVFEGDIYSTLPQGNFRTQPIYSDGTATISYNLRDLYSGGSASGSLIASSAGRYPDMRGFDPISIGNPGFLQYMAVDQGPVLQMQSFDWADQSAVLFHKAVSPEASLQIPAGTRYAVITFSAGYSSYTINLITRSTPNHSPIRIVLRGSLTTLTFTQNGSPISTVAGDPALPTSVSTWLSIELLFRGGVGGATQVYYVLDKSA